jgi:hypothetical protein
LGANNNNITADGTGIMISQPGRKTSTVKTVFTTLTGYFLFFSAHCLQTNRTQHFGHFQIWKMTYRVAGELLVMVFLFFSIKIKKKN